VAVAVRFPCKRVIRTRDCSCHCVRNLLIVCCVFLFQSFFILGLVLTDIDKFKLL